MKTFIAVSCLLAMASAQFHGGYNPAPQHGGYNAAPQQGGPTGGYQGPLHIPVLNSNGVPQEPAAVVQARNDHLANFGGAPAAHDHAHDQYQDQYQQPQQQYQQPQQYQQQPQQYQGQPQQYQHQHQHQPQRQVPLAKVGPDGFPQDAPDVAAAKAAHFALFAEANARNGVPHQAPQQHYAPAPQQHYSPAPQQHYAPAPQQHYAHAGLPQDTPEVAAAKAAHLAAHAALPPSAPQNHY